MAAAEIVINQANIQKLESFLNDSSYREAIENSCNFNSRLCAERRLRMPFLDPQTGVAQNHCNLFMSRKQRMPGAREGQIYTYPSQRWRKARRQYLTLKTARWGWLGSADSSLIPDGSNSLSGIPGDGDGAGNSTGPLSVDAAADTDSRDGSQAAGVSKEDMSKEWFYDELAMDELDALDDPPTPESDSDYCDDSYSSRKRTGTGGRGGATRGSGANSAAGNTGSALGNAPVSRGPGRRSNKVKEAADPEVTPTKGRGGKAGRGRRKAAPPVALPYEVPGDADKPFGCELCGARYKTRPGLTYHYSHSHKEGAAAAGGAADAATGDGSSTTASATSTPKADPQQPSVTTAGQLIPHQEYQDSYVTFLNNPSSAAAGAAPRRPRPPGAAGNGGEAAAPPVPPPPTEPSTSASAGSASEEEDDDVDGEGDVTPPATKPAVSSGRGRTNDKASPSPYCDFCLGDQSENKKTGTPEELVSCSDCGRSGKKSRQHPTGNGYKIVYPPVLNGTSHCNGFKSILMETLTSPKRAGRVDSLNNNKVKINVEDRIPKISPKDCETNGLVNKSTDSQVLMHSTSYSADDFDSFVARAMMNDDGGSSCAGADLLSSPLAEDISEPEETRPSKKRAASPVRKAARLPSVRRSARHSISSCAGKRGRKKKN